jgi:hypothetical protein
MNTYINEAFAKRMQTILTWTTFLLIGFAIAGVVVTWVYPTLLTPTNQLFLFYGVMLLMVLSLFMSRQTQRFLPRRDRPRPDKTIIGQLKGVGKSYALYSFYFPVDHVLVGPAGVFTVVTRHQGGKLLWNDKRKRLEQVDSNFLADFFLQDGFGRPDAEATQQATRLGKWLQKQLGESAPPVQPLVLLANPKVDAVETKNAPILVLRGEQAKKHLRNQRGATLSREQLQKLEEVLKIGKGEVVDE